MTCQICPVCKAIVEYTDGTMGVLAMVPLPLHRRNPTGVEAEMDYAEHPRDPELCPCSEQLVPVKRD